MYFHCFCFIFLPNFSLVTSFLNWKAEKVTALPENPSDWEYFYSNSQLQIQLCLISAPGATTL